MRNIILSICAMSFLVTAVILANTVLNISRSEIEKKTEANLDTNIKEESNKVDSKSYKDGTFTSHLPIVQLETNGQTITKEENIWCTVNVVDNKNGLNNLKDKYDFQTAATLKYRGTSSLTYRKKQYRIEFYKKQEGTKKDDISVMGMDKEEDWVLSGPFLDRTLIRENLLYGVSREIMDWAPDTRYCEVFLDGEYQGVYLMIEAPKVSKSRVNLKGVSSLTGETAYMIQRQLAGNEDNPINTYGTYSGKTYNQISIRYPSQEKLTEKQKEWIRKDISEFERVLYSDKFDDKEKGYSKYIDVDSFVDYYLINEFAMISDAGYMSTIMYKNIGGKLKMTVWDFNNAFNNYTEAIDSKELYVYNNNWYSRLFQDKNFIEKVIKRYHELRKDVLSDEHLLKTIDDTVLYLGNAVDRNFQVWGYTFNTKKLLDNKQGIPRDPTSYPEAIRMLKEEIIARGNFLDNNIEVLYQYSIN